MEPGREKLLAADKHVMVMFVLADAAADRGLVPVRPAFPRRWRALRRGPCRGRWP